MGLALSIAACCFALFVFLGVIDDAILDFGATRLLTRWWSTRCLPNVRLATRWPSANNRFMSRSLNLLMQPVSSFSKSLGYEQLDQGSVHRAEYSRWGSSSVRLEGGFLASGGYPGEPGQYHSSAFRCSAFGAIDAGGVTGCTAQGRLARGCIERIWRDNSRDDAAGWVVFGFGQTAMKSVTEAVEGVDFSAPSLYDRATSISVLHSASGPRACIVRTIRALVPAQD